MFKVFMVEYFHPELHRYCQEYFRRVETAAARMVDLQAVGYSPAIETIEVHDD